MGVEPKFSAPILVVRPYFPDLEDFKSGLAELWENKWLSNNGPLVQRFERSLAGYMGVGGSNVATFVNGTLALEIGFHAMGLAGADVITTPFTFVATAHALKRIGATPVFADVDPRTFCLSPAEAEKHITHRTRAIVPVHVYGHPCDVVGFERLGRKYGIKIIYDAAHAFGVKIGGKDISSFGDMSMFSFHPTKLFHSGEGGALVFQDAKLRRKLDQLRNFAIMDETRCIDVGTNAKMNEMNALMGLECFKALPKLLASRAEIHAAYRSAFADCVEVEMPDPANMCAGLLPNYAYCPILVRDFETRERLYSRLKEYNVFARRYFYPLLTDFDPYIYGKNSCPIAKSIADRVLTLPTYYGLSGDTAREIAEIVKEILRSA